MVFPTAAAVQAVSATRQQTLPTESAEECQCQPYQAMEKARAIPKNFAPIAQPQLSPRTPRLLLAADPTGDSKLFIVPSVGL